LTAAIVVAASCFALNFLIGVKAQYGGGGHVRWLHHGLYFLTCAATLVVVLLAWLQGGAWGWPLALLGALLTMSRTRPGRVDHAVLACVLAVGFGLTAWRLL